MPFSTGTNLVQINEREKKDLKSATYGEVREVCGCNENCYKYKSCGNQWKGEKGFKKCDLWGSGRNVWMKWKHKLSMCGWEIKKECESWLEVEM